MYRMFEKENNKSLPHSQKSLDSFIKRTSYDSSENNLQVPSVP